jgi:predicted RNA-binding protein with TRAM domain
MAQKTKSSKVKPKKPPLPRGEATEATIEEFERERMGIAPKE